MATCHLLVDAVRRDDFLQIGDDLARSSCVKGLASAAFASNGRKQHEKREGFDAHDRSSNRIRAIDMAITRASISRPADLRNECRRFAATRLFARTRDESDPIHQTGGPEVLKLEDVELPPPGPGQVRVRHTAIGVNFIDTYHRSGLYKLPLPSGSGQRSRRRGRGVGRGVTTLKPATASPMPARSAPMPRRTTCPPTSW